MVLLHGGSNTIIRIITCSLAMRHGEQATYYAVTNNNNNNNNTLCITGNRAVTRLGIDHVTIWAREC